MSFWTRVRVLYDVRLGYPKMEKGTKDIENGMGHLGLTQMYHAAVDTLGYRDTIFQLGSETHADISLKVQYGSSKNWNDKWIRIDDRGQLIIIGDLRDCMKCEFVEKLNEFIEHLKYYGIFITDALVDIE